jgi:hypothetical protein
MKVSEPLLKGVSNDPCLSRLKCKVSERRFSPIGAQLHIECVYTRPSVAVVLRTVALSPDDARLASLF